MHSSGSKKLSSQPLRFIIDTETHTDHTYGHFLFPSAVIINHEGAEDERRQPFDAKRIAAGQEFARDARGDGRLQADSPADRVA
jgi:glyoxylase-like metal-dependent hydrolase (beta-lactamase superfamily II)